MQTTFSSTKRSSSISINFIVPQGWHELSDKQLRYVYQLLANEFATDEVKTLCLLQWSGIKVIGRQDTGSYLLKKGKILFEVTPLTLAELLPHLAWLGSIPTVPVRISKINRQHALPADFSEVPFETFIICDNLYKGYLQTQDDNLLDQLGSTLYGKSMTFKPYERINIFCMRPFLRSMKRSNHFKNVFGSSFGFFSGFGWSAGGSFATT